jgi:hypothetical protein
MAEAALMQHVPTPAAIGCGGDRWLPPRDLQSDARLLDRRILGVTVRQCPHYKTIRGDRFMKALRSLALAFSIAALSGCAASMAYRADYVPDKPVTDSDRITGRVLIYTMHPDDDRLITAGATSFTGSGMQLTTPTGMMTREIAVKVFSKLATDGANAGNDLKDADRYAMILRPQTTDFSHGFPQLKNLGFAITPEVRVSMRMSILDSAGKSLNEKEYDSGVVSGSSYMMSGSPVERINRLAHETLYDLMRRAAADVRAFQQAHSQGSAQP